MFTALYYIVASTGTYHGRGISKSPKQAYSQAEQNAWDELMKGDAKAKYCSGIAVEGHRVWLNGKLRAKVDLL